MTSDQAREGFLFCCDDCGTVRDPGKLGRGSAKRSFQEEWADAKEEGWRAVKDSRGNWSHRCPDC